MLVEFTCLNPNSYYMNEKLLEVRVGVLLSRSAPIILNYLSSEFIQTEFISLYLSRAFDLNYSRTQKINSGCAFVDRNRNINLFNETALLSNYLRTVCVTANDSEKKEEKYFG